MLGALAAGLRAFASASRETVRGYGLLVAATGLGILINGTTAVVLNSMVLAYLFFWLMGRIITAAGNAQNLPVVRT